MEYAKIVGIVMPLHAGHPISVKEEYIRREHVVQTFCFPDLLHSLEKEKRVEMKCGIWGNHQNNAGLAGTPRMRWEAVNSPRMCSPGLIRRRFCAYLEKRRTKSGK